MPVANSYPMLLGRLFVLTLSWLWPGTDHVSATDLIPMFDGYLREMNLSSPPIYSFLIQLTLAVTTFLFFLEIIHFHSVSHRCAMIFSRVSVWLRTVFPVSSSSLVDDDAGDRGLQELSTDCGDYFPLIVDSLRLGAFFCSVSYVIEIHGHKEVRIAFEPSSLCV